LRWGLRWPIRFSEKNAVAEELRSRSLSRSRVGLLVRLGNVIGFDGALEDAGSVLRSDLIRILRILIALSLVSHLFAASTFPSYPVRLANAYAVSAETDGLTIGIEAVEDPKEQETYFHTPLAPKGFAPIFVVIQNGSNGDSFLFDKTKVTYGPADSGVSTPKEGSKAGQSLAAAAVPFVGLFAAIKIISNASEVQQNFLKKEIQSTTLSPGASAHGFLYIQVPKNAPRQKIHLRVPITRTGADKTFVLDLFF
jgi:hypothetical protein